MEVEKIISKDIYKIILKPDLQIVEIILNSENDNSQRYNLEADKEKSCTQYVSYGYETKEKDNDSKIKTSNKKSNKKSNNKKVKESKIQNQQENKLTGKSSSKSPNKTNQLSSDKNNQENNIINIGTFAKILHSKGIDIGRNRLFDYFRTNV